MKHSRTCIYFLKKILQQLLPFSESCSKRAAEDLAALSCAPGEKRVKKREREGEGERGGIVEEVERSERAWVGF